MVKKLTSVLLLVLYITNIFSCGTVFAAEQRTIAHAAFAGEHIEQEQGNCKWYTSASRTDNRDSFELIAAAENQGSDKYQDYTFTEETSRIGIDIYANSESCKNYSVTVSYTDKGYGWFVLQYKSSDGGICNSEKICTEDSGTVKSKTFTFTDMVFDNGLSGGWSSDVDLIVTNYLKGEMYYYSREPVYITEISVTEDGTYSPVKPICATPNIGNIFYTGESIAFDIEYLNKSDFSVDVDIQYSAYLLNADKSMSDVPSVSDAQSLNIKGNGSKEISIEFDVEKYGLYYLSATISGTYDGKPILTKFGQEFSKCVYNNALNKTFGAAAHMYGGRGEPEKGFLLMKNAGMGVVREAPHWSFYETARGNGKLSDLTKRSYAASAQYGMDRILTILCRNKYIDKKIEINDRYSLPSDEVLGENGTLAEYVKEYMSLPDVKQSVTMVEIENEPENTKYINGERLDPNTKWSDIGVRYAKVAKTVADAVHEVDPSMKVGGFTVGSLALDGVKEIVKAGLNELNQAESDCLDVFTAHPYMRDVLPEKVAEYICEYDQILSEKNYNVDNMWFSEMGWSSSPIGSNRLAIGSEYEAAKRILRQYITLKAKSFNYVMCLYDLIDDGDVRNMHEANFGLLHCYRDTEVPYAAKYGYLAVAAMNRFTAGAVDAQSVLSENGKYITKFSGNTVRDVYVIWTSETTDSITVEKNKLSDGKITYYDMLGNKMEAAEVENGENIRISDSPIFAVIGEPIEDITNNGQGNNIVELHVKGNINSQESDKMVSLTVLPADVEFNFDMANRIEFYDQSVTHDGGAYRFDALINGGGAEYNAYVVCENGETSIFTVKMYDTDKPALALRNGIVKLKAFELNAIDISDLQAEISFKNREISVNYTLMCAGYKGNTLTDVRFETGEFKPGEDNTRIYDLSMSEKGEYDRIVLYAWENFNTLIPLCESQYFLRE